MMFVEKGEGGLEFRDYLGVLRRHRGIIAVTVGLIVGAALIVSFVQTPVYAATARMLIQPRPGISPFDEVNPGQRTDTAQFVATEIEVVEGEPVQDEVRRRLGSAPPVAVRPVGTTAVVQVVAESPDPKMAAAIADAYVDAYIANRRKQGVDETLAAQKEVQGQIDLLQKQIDGLDGQIATAQGATGDSLRAQRQTLVQQQALFKQTLDQQQVNMALITGGAQVVRSAAVPTSPVRPVPLRNGIIAVAVGLALGMGLAFLVDYLDDSVKTSDDIEKVPGGPPVIGRIPVVSGWRPRDEPVVISATDPTAVTSEAYRTLRTAIQFLGLDHPMKTVQITSANAGEGKTTTLANLGVAMSAAGLHVVMVCCDLRRPRIHEFFGLDNEIGFTSVLLGTESLSGAIQPIPGNDHLSLLASGPLPPNPSEQLSSKRTAEVLTSLKARADIVLIDCPPVLPVTDALVLSGRVDATLMVSVAGATTRKEVLRTIELLRRVDAPLVGAVLNGVDDSVGYGYNYKYYRYARHEKGADQGKTAQLGKMFRMGRTAAPAEQPVAVDQPVPAPVEQPVAVDHPVALEVGQPVAVEQVPVEVGQVPVEQVPVEQVPVEQVPVEQVPVEQVPVEQVPVEQVPVEQVPVEQVPVEQVPVEQVAVEQVAVEQVAVGQPVAVEPVAVEQVAVEPMAFEQVAVGQPVGLEQVAAGQPVPVGQPLRAVQPAAVAPPGGVVPPTALVHPIVEERPAQMETAQPERSNT